MVSETINFNALENGRNAIVAPDEITSWNTGEEGIRLLDSEPFYEYLRSLPDQNSEPWDDTSIGLRGELDGAEYYALVRIFNAHILTQDERALIVSIIHGSYPRSNVYWHEHHETDETNIEWPNYCHSSSSRMDSKLIALEAINLLHTMERSRENIDAPAPWYESSIWIIRPEE